jgi:cytoplasmic FMR1 interacting protein
VQLSETMKQNQADLYLETYQVLDIEIGRLREMQRWQSSAAFKVLSLMYMCVTFPLNPKP